MKERKRISVTLTKYFTGTMDRLVKEGAYLDGGSVIREALRNMFKEVRPC